MKNLYAIVLFGGALMVVLHGIGAWREVRLGSLVLEKRAIELEESRFVWEHCENGGMYEGGEIRCKVVRGIIYAKGEKEI